VRAGSKFILDALVDEGILETDGPRQVVALEDLFDVDHADPRVEVEVVECRVA